ncbi:ABC transporter permease [Paenibacillus sp. J5C_2022]|uniref:ABC transporter permease n=1 Tax=Paenibacillus sp. J5C2022 TaxID=2977129 RepID=UPI0021D34A3E|nr:ABC transporter permease [Paenibacillus sp. J5C2022]MCU6709194.1 ABC transporter permease [Paenibacillus sp. J5C2022]
MTSYLLNLNKYKDLFIELVIQDVKLKYRNSYIGIVWSMLNPILMMIVLTIIFSALFERTIDNFPVYVLTGRLVYTYFSEATNFALESLRSNSQLIKKVYVPKYFFPMSRVCSSFITSCISIVPIIIVMFVTGMDFSLYNLLIIVPLSLLFAICSGIGLILSTINVFFRDIKHFYTIILTMLMYATPIFYPEEIIPEKYKFLIELNPMFSIVGMVRDVVMYNMFPNLMDILFALFYSIILLFIGLFIFYKNQDRFILYL